MSFSSNTQAMGAATPQGVARSLINAVASGTVKHALRSCPRSMRAALKSAGALHALHAAERHITLSVPPWAREAYLRTGVWPSSYLTAAEHAVSTASTWVARAMGLLVAARVQRSLGATNASEMLGRQVSESGITAVGQAFLTSGPAQARSYYTSLIH